MAFEATTEFQDCTAGVGGISTDTELLCKQMESVQLRQEEMAEYYLQTPSEVTIPTLLDSTQVSIQEVRDSLIEGGVTHTQLSALQANTNELTPIFQDYYIFSVVVFHLVLLVWIIKWLHKALGF